MTEQAVGVVYPTAREVVIREALYTYLGDTVESEYIAELARLIELTLQGDEPPSLDSEGVENEFLRARERRVVAAYRAMSVMHQQTMLNYDEVVKENAVLRGQVDNKRCTCGADGLPPGPHESWCGQPETEVPNVFTLCSWCSERLEVDGTHEEAPFAQAVLWGSIAQQDHNERAHPGLVDG